VICLANKAGQGSSRLAKEAGDGVAAEPSASTAQIQEDNRQIVTELVLHEGTRDPRHRPFERRRRPCRYVACEGVICLASSSRRHPACKGSKRWWRRCGERAGRSGPSGQSSDRQRTRLTRLHSRAKIETSPATVSAAK
jgi:hypothetical protein